MQLFDNILREVENGVDPDQTAQEQSDLCLRCLHMLLWQKTFRTITTQF